MKRNRLSEEDIQSFTECSKKLEALGVGEEFNEDTFKEIIGIVHELELINKRHILTYVSLIKQGYVPD